MTTEETKKVEQNADTQVNKTENPAGARPPFRKFDRNQRRPFGGFNKDRKSKFSKRGKRPERGNQEPEYFNEVLSVRRVTRVVKGGKRMRFSALIVLGDKNGKIGYGIKKGLDFQSAVQKATNQAKKNMLKISLTEARSLPFTVKVKYKAAEVFLKPAESGTGLIAGSFVRSVLQLAGVENVYSKILGSNNKIAGVQATFKALEKFKKN